MLQYLVLISFGFLMVANGVVWCAERTKEPKHYLNVACLFVWTGGLGLLVSLILKLFIL